MARRIAAVELPLPNHWYWIPEVGRGVAGWDRAVADEIVPPEHRDDTSQSLLVAQLGDVYDTVAETGFTNARTAVFSPPPWYDRLLGMLTVQVSPISSLGGYVTELATWTSSDDTLRFQSVRPFEAEIPAGSVAGAHLVLGHPGLDDVGRETQTLEERVVAAVAPINADNLVEVVAIAASLGVFPDFRQTVLDLLQPLTIQMEESHG